MVYEKDITVAESSVSLDILDTASNVSNITFFWVLTKKLTYLLMHENLISNKC